jgi:nitroimidazol reductase NimA-like FMN-containing flavoprotein (pyridoxamine 5'-phosphate oxidase superfamily)
MSDLLRHLSREECLSRLGTERLGRISLSMQALPAIVPMYYALLDDDIIVRTRHGTRLTAALIGGVVGFEADSVSDGHTSGWSVLVVGQAREVHDPDHLDHMRELPLDSAFASEGDHYVTISTERISGRAFGPL